MFSEKSAWLAVIVFVLVLPFIWLSVGKNAYGQRRGERLREILEQRRGASKASDRNLQEIVVAGSRRTYLVHLPPGYDKAKRLPLVLAFHGGGGNAQNMAQMSVFSQKADREKFVVVYPNGLGRMENILLTWNAGGCCDYAMEQNIDDVRFVSELIDALVTKYGVDKKRVYATGFSNGALLSHRLAAEIPDKIAAIAPVAGALFDSSPKPKGKVPVLIIHGLADMAVPYKGGDSQRNRVKNAQSEPYKSLDYAAKYWAKNNGCKLVPTKKTISMIVREAYPGCTAKNDVEVIMITDGLHSWPGGKKGRDAGDESSTAISATDAIWDFFRGRSK